MHFALARAYTRAGRKQEAAREREAFLKYDKLYREQRADDKSGKSPASNEEKP